MVYVDYEYYTDNYYGTLPESSFNPLALKASREIDNNVNTSLNEEIINNLSEEAQDKLKYTTCALIDLFDKKETADNRKVSSISIDGVNKTFKSTSMSELRIEKRRILETLPNELTKYL